MIPNTYDYNHINIFNSRGYKKKKQTSIYKNKNLLK